MIHASIERIDMQAQSLLQLLADADKTLTASLDPDRIAAVERARLAVIDLRRALLGAQMGSLYWDATTGSSSPTQTPGPESPPGPAG